MIGWTECWSNDVIFFWGEGLKNKRVYDVVTFDMLCSMILLCICICINILFMYWSTIKIDWFLFAGCVMRKTEFAYKIRMMRYVHEMCTNTPTQWGEIFQTANNLQQTQTKYYRILQINCELFANIESYLVQVCWLEVFPPAHPYTRTLVV